MTRERYMTLSAAALKDIAKARGVKHYYALKKEELIETLEREAAYLEQNGDPAASAEMKAISTRIKREL